MAEQKPDPKEVISLRLRLPAGIHRLLTQRAKENGHSLNSEILWCLAAVLGGAAQDHIEQMKVWEKKVLQHVMQTLSDPEMRQKAMAEGEARRAAGRRRGRR
jgi:hypothetical protein